VGELAQCFTFAHTRIAVFKRLSGFVIWRTNCALVQPEAHMKQMQAAVVRRFHEPLSIEELPIPALKPDQILIKTEACGVCHTDLHAADGDWPIKPNPPFVPGHEAVGTVVELGRSVRSFKKATVPAFHGSTAPAANASSASRDGRRCARTRNTAATP
jgi:Zn-dependent alcohol dehydrogenase